MSSRKNLSLPVFLSVLLHVSLLAAIILKFDFFKKEEEPYRPQYITATLVDMTPKAKPAPQQPKEQNLEKPKEETMRDAQKVKQQEKQEAEAQAIKQKEQQEQKDKEQQKLKEKLAQEKAKKEADEKAKADKQKKADEEAKAKAEADKKAKADKQRKEELKALEAALQKEEKLIADNTTADVNTKSYEQMIAERVRQNWSRPPSARNGMTTVLEIQMLPTGQVVGVRVVKSSGDVIFDRAAEQAVKRVDRFEEVKNIPSNIFEKYFRQFLFTFRPEDLRQ